MSSTTFLHRSLIAALTVGSLAAGVLPAAQARPDQTT